jgi:hypothetical protein
MPTYCLIFFLTFNPMPHQTFFQDGDHHRVTTVDGQSVAYEYIDHERTKALLPSLVPDTALSAKYEAKVYRAGPVNLFVRAFGGERPSGYLVPDAASLDWIKTNLWVNYDHERGGRVHSILRVRDAAGVARYLAHPGYGFVDAGLFDSPDARTYVSTGGEYLKIDSRAEFGNLFPNREDCYKYVYDALFRPMNIKWPIIMVPPKNRY